MQCELVFRAIRVRVMKVPMQMLRKRLRTIRTKRSSILVVKQGWRISEVPVDWIEDLDTRVAIVDTAMKDIKGLLRVRGQWMLRSRSSREVKSAA